MEAEAQRSLIFAVCRKVHELVAPTVCMHPRRPLENVENPCHDAVDEGLLGILQ